MRKPVFDVWEREANAAHNNKYANGYKKLKVMWNNIRMRDECPIDCPEHGEFLQQPGVHRKGHGCCECVGLKRFTTETIKDEFRKAHGDRYDYSLVEYVNMHTNIKIVCPKEKHGMFEQLPTHHKRGSGCPACGGNREYTTETLIAKFREVHGPDMFDYSMVEWIDAFTEVSIKCNKNNHIFEQLPNTHILGFGCSGCSGCKKHTNETIKKRFIETHGNLYIYDFVEYQNNHTKVAIGCKEEDHGLFHQTPSNHIKGQGCPKCLHRNETRVEIALNKLGIKHTKISIEANNRKYYPDFFLPDYNMYIEYQGLQHYEGRRFSSKITQVDADAELILQQKRDIEVRQYCKENGIGLLEIDGRKYQGKRIEKFLTEYFAGKLIK